MTNQEIDKRLALAIGYTADRVRNVHGFVQVLNHWGRNDGPMSYNCWQRFDHTDPAVIWPIAERFDCFPLLVFNYGWVAHSRKLAHVELSKSPCPATASALAVINYCESKK